MKVAAFTSLAGLDLDRDDPSPLHRQLYESLQRAILGGRLREGTRLPSTRALAAELGVSRNTVSRAYEQLTGEGYAVATVGSGTRVRHDLPRSIIDALDEEELFDDAPHHSGGRQTLPPVMPESGSQGVRGQQYFLSTPKLRAFCPALPALDAFPKKKWERATLAAWRAMSTDDLGYLDPGGYEPLRKQVAEHVRLARGIRCDASQVLITTGTQQSLSLLTQLLLKQGDSVWLENPGFVGSQVLLRMAGMRMIAVPVDGEGLDVTEGQRRAPRAKMAYVSPSHQYPLGVTMSVPRRLRLLQWAKDAEAWIIEDDYDSEFRYTGYPLQALQGLDTADRVVYVGTFSKSVFPALRVGYVIAPPPLVAALREVLAYSSRGVSLLNQVTLATFMERGDYARHIRRMRSLYARRREVLERQVRDRFQGMLEVDSQQAGLHMIGWLPPGVDDVEVSALLAGAGIDAPPVSMLYLEKPAKSGLILGYTTPESELVGACGRMRKVLQGHLA